MPVSGPGYKLATKADLKGKNFVAKRITDRRIVPGTLVQVNFSNKYISADSGCNSFGSKYRVKSGYLRYYGDWVTTLIDCGRGPLGRQEGWMRRFLSSNPRAFVLNDRLRLAGNGQTVTFRHRGSQHIHPGR